MVTILLHMQDIGGAPFQVDPGFIIPIDTSIYNLHKSSQTVKKGAAHAKKAA